MNNTTIGQEDRAEYINKAGTIKVVWSNSGEGLNGDWDADDPHDINLLRFTVLVLHTTNDPHPTVSWIMPEESSYCTQMPANTPRATLERAARRILDQFGEKWASGDSYRRILEELSWIGPGDFGG